VRRARGWVTYLWEVVEVGHVGEQWHEVGQHVVGPQVVMQHLDQQVHGAVRHLPRLRLPGDTKEGKGRG
jgi:hypothetical protein